VALAGEWYRCGDPKRYTVDPALVAVENNHSSGQRVLEYLKDILKYKRLYTQREINAKTKNFERRIGWRTDERSRWILLDYLAELIRKDLVLIPDAQTVRELTTFVFDDNGKPAGAEGTHDDRVISLALAAQMEREHRHAALMVQAVANEWATSDTGSGW
jgi:phage terminase large subunit